MPGDLCDKPSCDLGTIIKNDTSSSNMNTPVQVWNGVERPQTLADKSFAPTSIENVEFPDDKEPDVFRANRAAMHANSSQELTDLHAMNQQTTAYSTLSCVAPPLSNVPPPKSTPPACEVASMEERSHAITAYPLFPQFQQQIKERCDAMPDPTSNPKILPPASGEPPIGKKPRRPYKYITSRMMNSVRGAIHDMKHYDELPPAKVGKTPEQVANFVVTRDNRGPYLLLMLMLVLVLVALVSVIKN